MEQLIPINTAEAIIDPFWDPGLSELSEWTVHVEPGSTLKQNWCNVPFTWEQIPKGDLVASIHRNVDIDVERFDLLLLSLVNAADASVTIGITGDGGEKEERFDSDGEKHELPVDISSYTRIRQITIGLYSSGTPGSGHFNWIGVQNKARLAEHLKWLDNIAATASHYLAVPETAAFRPSLGVILNDDEVTALQARSKELEKAAEELELPEPHTLISDFIANGPDTRYSRERDHGMNILGRARAVAVLGVALKRADLLKRATEYAIIEALTPSWDWAFISKTPGSAFEIRSFMQTVVLVDLVTILDLARDFLTEPARKLIERRIAEDGLGNINYNSWMHEYIHTNNQLAAFSTGRIAAYCALEKSWPRVTPYLELAVDELVASLKKIMLSDGGFVEGPGYLHYTMSGGLTALEMYARTRGRSLEDVAPDEVLATARFADALGSTDISRDHIPVCDAHDSASPVSLAMLASLLPDSSWTTIYRKRLKRKGIIPGVPEIMRDEKIPASGPSPSTFIKLEEMRLAASYRKAATGPVKIVVLGNQPNAGHTHEDKGSFILEAAHQTVFMDPGICAYSNPLTEVMKHCQRHNMLVPIGTDERPRPQNPIRPAVEISASGDETRFSAHIDCTPGWDGWYAAWHRDIVSPDPTHIVVRDRWTLSRGTGVAFLLQTILPVESSDGVIRVGEVAIVTPPEGAVISVVEVPYPESEIPQRTIRFVTQKFSGESEVQIEILGG